MSFGNGEVSHSEMGRENSMTCRAKTYGNSFTEEGQKEKMEGSGTLSTAWDQEPLERGVPLQRNVLNHQGEKLTGTVSQWRDKERIRKGLSHSARQGTNTLWNGLSGRVC